MGVSIVALLVVGVGICFLIAMGIAFLAAMKGKNRRDDND